MGLLRRAAQKWWISSTIGAAFPGFSCATFLSTTTNGLGSSIMRLRRSVSGWRSSCLPRNGRRPRKLPSSMTAPPYGGGWASPFGASNRNRRCLLETMVGGALTNSCSSGASFGMTDIIKLLADWSAYCGIAYRSQCNRTAVCVISAGLSGHI
jgi:hypothetical protein